MFHPEYWDINSVPEKLRGNLSRWFNYCLLKKKDIPYEVWEVIARKEDREELALEDCGN